MFEFFKLMLSNETVVTLQLKFDNKSTIDLPIMPVPPVIKTFLLLKNLEKFKFVIVSKYYLN